MCFVLEVSVACVSIDVVSLSCLVTFESVRKHLFFHTVGLPFRRPVILGSLTAVSKYVYCKYLRVLRLLIADSVCVPA